jgi:DNA-binding Lrp family transcriptional regulator
MIEAYILLRIKPGMDRVVYRTVSGLDKVKDLQTVYGEYDLLMRIEVEAMEDLDVFIFDTIRTIEGVEGTTTLITIEPPN